MKSTLTKLDTPAREEDAMATEHRVEIAPEYQGCAERNDDRVIARASVHISRDPITGEYEFAVFTDDGRGNGEWVLTAFVIDARTAELSA